MKSIVTVFTLLLIHFIANGQIEPKQGSQIYMTAEEMPRFPGCEMLESGIDEKEKCARKRMLKYIYDNLNYPERAKSNKVEGMVVVQFIVNELGAIEDAKVVRPIGFECDEEALRVVEGMNEMDEPWVPGKQRGEIVRLLYTLPIRFKLP